MAQMHQMIPIRLPQSQVVANKQWNQMLVLGGLPIRLPQSQVVANKQWNQMLVLGVIKRK
jgi:hypothetical protein